MIRFQLSHPLLPVTLGFIWKDEPRFEYPKLVRLTDILIRHYFVFILSDSRGRMRPVSACWQNSALLHRALKSNNGSRLVGRRSAILYVEDKIRPGSFHLLVVLFRGETKINTQSRYLSQLLHSCDQTQNKPHPDKGKGTLVPFQISDRLIFIQPDIPHFE